MCISIKVGGHVDHDERMNPINFGDPGGKITMGIYGNNLVNTIETNPLCAFPSNLASACLSMISF